MKYSRVWFRLAKMRFRELYIESRISSLFLISGKLVRFSFFLIFIVALLSQAQSLAGFNLNEVLLFYMTFNLIDITIQFLLRGAYSVKQLVDRGQFDLFLTQPVNTLFRIASDIIDLLDLATLVPVLAALGIIIARLETIITPVGLFLYLALCLNALLIALAIHIFVISLSVMTQEISSQIWIYRDLMTMGRFPVDIYARSIQFVLTFIIPIAIMISFPAKVLIGVLSIQWIAAGFIISLIFFSISLFIWKLALKNYSSISA